VTIGNAEHCAVRSKGGARKIRGRNDFPSMGNPLRAVSQSAVSAAS
jgi:hypothetical protein